MSITRKQIGLLFADIHMDWDRFRGILEKDDCKDHYTEALDMLIHALEDRKRLGW